MQIMTEWFGPVDIDPATTLTFPVGLPGFEDCTRFKLLHDEQKANPLVRWLQSLDRPDVTFSVVDPAIFDVRYELTLTDEETNLLSYTEGDHVVVLMLLGRSEDASVIVPKAKFPILLNLDKQTGLQKQATTCELVFRNV
ncbi:flagellar assembly protein FliW [Leeia sp. TBRC 13508]|uniref:Flagellar assembly factor FliW n=1 Tax=Leeia speluncae TaxID=2884804 RepID=A0ABS8D7L3_9NEIS|nr:flagellar assembly protein FliW [Leeia speluncae]MCB6184174.1 flagellar assembly protein FliW [Leeia speluncae]